MAERNLNWNMVINCRDGLPRESLFYTIHVVLISVIIDEDNVSIINDIPRVIGITSMAQVR